MKTGVKLILAGIFILILVFIANIYISLNGNPITIEQTKARAEEYIHKKYPKVEIGEITTGYNAKMNWYYAKITTKAAEPVSFNIEFNRNGSIYENYISSKLEREATELIKPMIEKILPKARSIEASVHIEDKEQFNEDTVYTKQLPVEILIEVRWDDDGITKEAFARKALEIRDAIKAENIKVLDYFFSCAFNRGKDSYVVSLEKDIMDIGEEELLKGEEINQFTK